jgi:hypothetical protein
MAEKNANTTYGSESNPGPVHNCMSSMKASPGDDKLWKWDSNDVFATRDKTNPKDKYNFLKLTNQRASKAPLKVDVSVVLTKRVKRLHDVITSDDLTHKAVSQYFPDASNQDMSHSARTNGDPRWQSERHSHQKFYPSPQKENSLQIPLPDQKFPAWSHLHHLKKAAVAPLSNLSDLETKQRLKN